MRARLLTAAAVTASVASLVVVAFVLARPDFARPPGISGEAPRWSDLVGPVAATAAGAALSWVRPHNKVGALILFVALCQGLSLAAAAYGMYGVGIADPRWPGARWVAFLGAPLWIPGLLATVTILLAIYPEGRLAGPRWRWPTASAAIGIVLLTATMPGSYHEVAAGPAPLTIHAPTAVKVVVAVVTAMALLGGGLTLWAMSIARLARSRPPERQQLAWLVVPIMAAFPLFFAPEWPGDWLVSIIVPVAIAVGVMRYQAFGIEVVLRRGLVYGTLTAALIGVYLLVAAVAGSGLSHAAVPGVVAAALVALGLSPFRERLQRGVDRLVYGDRRDPMRAVARFADSVAAAGEPEELLPAVLMTVMNAVRAPGAAVLSPEGRLVATHGCLAAGVTLPLLVSGRDVGTLLVAARKPGEPYTEGDLRLLAALVPQVAVVLRALELAEALESERDRVVTATRTERDRLRRDLHDGLGPSLSGVGLGLQALESALEARDDATASELLTRVRVEARIAVDEVRRILDDLRPAALDEASLIAAMRRHADTITGGIPIELDAGGQLPPLPPDVEAAAYRIAQEALNNVVRHAGASSARLSLVARGDVLRLEVTDDGHGFVAARRPGVGLASMRHRAETLGGTLDVSSGDGGTRVVASLPLGSRP